MATTDSHPQPTRIVVNAVGDPAHGFLAESRFIERPFLPGGEHNLYELAFAAAALGHEVELRGWLHRPAFERMAEKAGVAPTVEIRARRPTAEDLVVVPEGWRDPLDYGRLLLSPARLAIFILAAPGLFGWPFVAAPWEPPDPIAVALDDLARPEHFQGMAALGFRLMTHSPGIAAAARSAGVDCSFVGTGRPALDLPDADKDVDVVAVLDNRWAPLAEQVLAGLGGLSVDRVTTVSNYELLARLARARVLVWPSRIEGHATIPWEARSVGCVPVALSSNRFAVGLDEEHGAVVLDRLDELGPAVQALLADASRWEQMSQLGRTTAPLEVDWDAYLRRVEDFLRTAVRPDPACAPRAGIGAALNAWIEGRLAEYQAHLQAKTSELVVAARDLTEAMRKQESMIAEISHWRQVDARQRDELRELHAKNADLHGQLGALDAEYKAVEARLTALRNRRAVRAALKIADTVKLRRS
jgi:hypothetical protein